MSTNNYHHSRPCKDVLPKWLQTANENQSMPKISGDKLDRMMTNKEAITALTLSGRECSQIVDLNGLSKLRRLDLSSNKLKRIQGMRCVTELGMLNVSRNNLEGSQSLEELRYLPELRTLNIGYNPKLLHLESHIVKGKLKKLQALVCNECGFKSVAFLRFLNGLNTLILSGNRLTDFPPANDFSMTTLTKLSLSKNNLQEVPNLEFCVNIQELRLNGNQISTIPSSVSVAKKLKVLDLSNNLINSWDSVEELVNVQQLTNLSLKGIRIKSQVYSSGFIVAVGNPLPDPPDTYDNTQLREDYSDSRIEESMKKYRHHVLSMFQIKVGKEGKTKERLIVFDSKRVKMKWSHRGDGSTKSAKDTIEEHVDLEHITSSKRDIGTNKGDKEDIRHKKRRKQSHSGKRGDEPTNSAQTTDWQPRNDKVPEASKIDSDNIDIRQSNGSYLKSQQYASESGVIEVKDIKKKTKMSTTEKNSAAHSVDMDVFKGNHMVNEVGGGGNSAWD